MEILSAGRRAAMLLAAVALIASACTPSSALPAWTYQPGATGTATTVPAGATAGATAGASAGPTLGPTAGPTTGPTSEATPAPSAAGPTEKTVFIPAALNEWHVATPTTVKAGTITIEAANFGTLPHELLVFKSDLALSAYPLDADGNIVEDGAGITLVSDAENIEPGKTQSRDVDLSVPGTYLFVCNIPGHFKAGMFITVMVTP